MAPTTIGSSIDAVVDHKAETVQVVQRFNWKPSQLSVAWVNLSTGTPPSQ